MSETEELRQMVLTFRVSELQVLLGFAGKNKSGKKQELQARALDLVRMRSTPVQMKIRELHKRIPTSGVLEPTHNERSESSRFSAPQSPLKNHYPPMSRSGMLSMPGVSSLEYGGAGKHSQMSSSPGSSGFPVHPDVRFRSLPFYDILGELLKPTSLVPSNSTRFQETSFAFHLTPQQASDIAMSRDIRPVAKCEYSIQVQLRFCLLETSCDQEDAFPPSICVKVNSKICPLPNPIPTNKPGVEPKRPSRPVNITNLCKLCPTVPNYITVSWASEYGRAYVIGVYHVKRLNSCALLQRLRSAGVRNPDHTKAMIKEKLQQDPDSEIATTSLRGSLMCPLGKMRMSIPCRAKTCTHLQCFDASLYLQMNEKKPTWICPVCDKPALFSNLVIDGLFMEITSKAPSHCTEVQFHEDGTWTPLLSKKEMLLVGTPSPAKPLTPQPEKKKAKVEVIDLTIDSSTDEYDDETDTSSPMGIPNLPSISLTPISSSNTAATRIPHTTAPHSVQTTVTNSQQSIGGNTIPASIQVISLPSPSSHSSCSNSSQTSNNSSTSTSSYPSVIGSGVSLAPVPNIVTELSTGQPSPNSNNVAMLSPSSRGQTGAAYSNNSDRLDSSRNTASIQSSTLPGNSLYPNMPVIDTNPYFQTPSSFQGYLNQAPMYPSYQSYDLYSMLQNSDDRKIPSYSTSQTSPRDLLAPDVISLD